jgi:hypothetical protein
VAALQPDVEEASGKLLSKFAAPNDAMRAAKNRATPDKYFFIPPAKFRETYAANVPAPEAQFLADSQQQLAEKALGAPVFVAAWRTKPSYAILTTQDHVISPELQRWMYQRSGSKGHRGERKPSLCLSAGHGRPSDRGHRHIKCRSARQRPL